MSHHAERNLDAPLEEVSRVRTWRFRSTLATIHCSEDRYWDTNAADHTADLGKAWDPAGSGLQANSGMWGCGYQDAPLRVGPSDPGKELDGDASSSASSSGPGNCRGEVPHVGGSQG